MSKDLGADRALAASDGAASVSTLSGFDHGERLGPRALLEGATPGPWASFSYGSSEMDGLGLGVCVKGKSLEAAMGDDSVFICDFPPTMMANSHLAAAAPQLALTCMSQEERIAELEGALRAIAETRWDVGAADACIAMIRSDARRALTNTGDA